MTDKADNPAQTGVRVILLKHVSESAQNIIKNLRGGGGGVLRERERLPANRVSRKPRELETPNEIHLRPRL